MARLIRSEKEVEGRYEEVWTLVEEDALVQWPAGPGAVVGRDAPRVDGYEKARGEAFEIMIQHASEVGANAIIGARYDANEVMGGVTEVLAYGTAVVVEPVDGASYRG